MNFMNFMNFLVVLLQICITNYNDQFKSLFFFLGDLFKVATILAISDSLTSVQSQ